MATNLKTAACDKHSPRDYGHPVFGRTLYSIWPATTARRSWLSAKLASALGATRGEIHKIVEAGQPIASDVPGGIVCHIHSRLFEAGVAIRVEPAFLWRLEQPKKAIGGRR